VSNPERPGWDAGRELVGEIAAAVRAEELRFGVYYSGGIDWSVNPEPLLTMADFIVTMPGGAYPAYAGAQARELIERWVRPGPGAEAMRTPAVRRMIDDNIRVRIVLDPATLACPPECLRRLAGAQRLSELWRAAKGVSGRGHRHGPSGARHPIRRRTEPDRAMNETLTIRGVALNGHASLLAKGVLARAEARGEDSLITFSRPLTGASARVIRVETPAA
jgi:hypothetical protein